MDDITAIHPRSAPGAFDRGRRDDLSHFAARRAAKNCSAVIAAIQDGLISVDETGRIIDVNDIFCEMTGFSRSDLIGKRRYPFWARDHVLANATAITAGLDESGSGRAQVTLRMTHRDGRTFSVTMAIASIAGPEGTIAGFVGTLRSVDTDVRDDAPRTDTPGREERANHARVLTAEAIARGDSAAGTLKSIAGHVAVSMGADACVILRATTKGVCELTGWSGPAIPNPSIVLQPKAVANVLAGTSWRCDDVPMGNGLGNAATVAVEPILTKPGEVWGAVVILTSALTGRIDPAHAKELRGVVDSVELGILSVHARSGLEAQATLDPMTHLPNRRAFNAHLDREMSRSTRYGHDLSVIVIDVDNLRSLNAEAGLTAGDRAVNTVAETLQHLARASDVVARIGGDSFGWILPETDAHSATIAAERARQAVLATNEPGTVTLSVSAGVSDVRLAGDSSHDLVRQACHAVREAKSLGRNRVHGAKAVFETVSVAPERPRAQARAGLQLLAKAIDAKTGSGAARAAQGAALARRLALLLGWTPRRAAELYDAALVRDVGQITTPDDLLRPSGPLSRADRDVIAQHVTVGAEMVSGILTDEQAAWIAQHHHRYDGVGNADGTCGEAISEGARIIAVVDGWINQVLESRASADVEPLDASASLRGEAGGAFWPLGVQGLLAIVDDADAAPTEARPGFARRARHHITQIDDPFAIDGSPVAMRTRA